MMRLAHTAILTLLVAVALISYGAKEETRAKQAELRKLETERAALRAEIATLEVEWRHLTRPERLARLAEELSDELGGSVDAPLGPWRADQVLDLHAPLRRPPLSADLEITPEAPKPTRRAAAAVSAPQAQ